MQTAQNAREQAVAGKGEEDAGGAKDVAGEKSEHGDGGAGEHEKTQGWIDAGHGVYQRHGGVGECGSEDALRYDLDDDVEECDRNDGDDECSGNGPRRIGHFTACTEGDFHAREDKECQDKGATSCVPCVAV